LSPPVRGSFSIAYTGNAAIETTAALLTAGLLGNSPPIWTGNYVVTKTSGARAFAANVLADFFGANGETSAAAFARFQALVADPANTVGPYGIIFSQVTIAASTTPANVNPSPVYTGNADDDKTKGRNIGIGVGVGIGIPLVLALLIIAFCCCGGKKAAPKAAAAAPSMAAQNTTTSTSSASYDEGSYGLGGDEEYGYGGDESEEFDEGDEGDSADEADEEEGDEEY
jgi:hypothetical protein